MDISIADIAASTTAGLILWAIKSSRENRVKIETTLEMNRDAAVSALQVVNTGVMETKAEVGKLNMWAEQHQKQDDERHEESKLERQKLWEAHERRKAS